MAVVENLPEATHVPNLRHGAWSPVVVGARAAGIRAELDALGPDVAAMSLPGINLLCYALAQADLLNAYIWRVAFGKQRVKGARKGSPVTGMEAIPDHVWRAWHHANAVAANLITSLGLDLVGRAKVMKDSAVGRHFQAEELSKLRAVGAEKRRARLGTEER